MIVSFAAYQRVTDRQTDGRTDTPPVAKTLDQCHLLAQFSATKMLKKYSEKICTVFGSLTTIFGSYAQQKAQLSQRGCARFLSLNISLSHSRPLKVIRNDTLDYGMCKGPFIATLLNSTPLDVEAHELRRRVAIDTLPTQLNSTRRRDELSCVAINGP